MAIDGRAEHQGAGMSAELIEIACCDYAIEMRSTGVELSLRVHDTACAYLTMTALASSLRVYLTLEDIRGTFDGAVLRIYLKTPPGATGETYLGSVGLFGLRQASLGAGIQSHLDITPQLQQLTAAASASSLLQVSIRPHHQLPEGMTISIARISLCVELLGTPAPPDQPEEEK
jgi:hypothetical protein